MYLLVHDFAVVIWRIEHTVMVYWHNPLTPAIPWLLFIPEIPLRHPVKGANIFLQSGKLRRSVLVRLQLVGDIRKDAALQNDLLVKHIDGV